MNSASFCDIQATFRDIHKGKMGFLIGNGPSTYSVSPEALQPYVTMGVNETVFKFENLTYFFSCDMFVLNSGILHRVAELNTATKVILASDTAPWITGIVPREKLYSVQRKGSEHADKTDSKLVIGTSSVHPAAHLLYIMGCDPIVLIGCDCQLKDGLYAFWHLPPYFEKTTPFYKEMFGSDPKNSFNTVMLKRGSAPMDAMLGTHHGYWQSMARANPSMPIVDASEGRLECFKRMNLSQVLQTYGDRKTA